MYQIVVDIQKRLCRKKVREKTLQVTMATPTMLYLPFFLQAASPSTSGNR
jgi:hypothetical protein